MKTKRYVSFNDICFVEKTEDPDTHKRNAYAVIKYNAGGGKRSFLEYNIDIICSSRQQEMGVKDMLMEIKQWLG